MDMAVVDGGDGDEPPRPMQPFVPITEPITHIPSLLPNYEQAVVRNQDDCFSWADDYWQNLREVHGDSVLQHAEQAYRESDYSTAFTGVDAFGTAMMMSRHRLNELLGYPADDDEKIQPLEHKYSIEWCPDCNRELQDNPNPPQCRFENVSWFCWGNCLCSL